METNELYKMVDLGNGRIQARGIEYHETVAFLAEKLKEDPDARYKVEYEELADESWWEICRQPCRDKVYAWGDVDQAETWVEYLNKQPGSGDGGHWHIRRLRLREAFALGLNNPADGLNLAEAVGEIHPELLEHFDGALFEVESLAAPSLFEVAISDIEKSVRTALQTGERLEAFGVSEKGTSAALLALLERQGWTLDGDMLVRLQAAAA